MRDMVQGIGAFVVLLPVKSPGTGKSRLVELRSTERAALAAAFAADVVAACRATPAVAEVVMITDDLDFAATVPGVLPCADPGGGLNAALRQGATMVRRARPGLRPVALCADLPALDPVDLAAALDLVAQQAGPCFVADAEGSGTTLYSAEYDAFDPHYGPGSSDAHRATGALALPGQLSSLRHDVDDIADLTAAVTLGVGPSTTAALAEVALPSP